LDQSLIDTIDGKPGTDHTGTHVSRPKLKKQREDIRHTLYKQDRQHNYEIEALEREFQRREDTKDHELKKLRQKMNDDQKSADEERKYQLNEIINSKAEYMERLESQKKRYESKMQNLEDKAKEGKKPAVLEATISFQ
jgi:murein L,D-transpeptidase YcbB/YkuD